MYVFVSQAETIVTDYPSSLASDPNDPSKEIYFTITDMGFNNQSGENRYVHISCDSTEAIVLVYPNNVLSMSPSWYTIDPFSTQKTITVQVKDPSNNDVPIDWENNELLIMVHFSTTQY